MLRSMLAELLSGPLYRDFRFQLRLVVVVSALFVFIFPSLVGMNLFYIDLLSEHAELQGYPGLPTAVTAFFEFLDDAVVRQVILGLIFIIGLIFILGASHTEKRLRPILAALGLLMIMQSVFFLLVATDRCIPTLGCGREFFVPAMLLACSFGLASALIPYGSRRFVGWFALPYISILIYQSFLWLLTLAQTPLIALTWESTYAILLVFVTMLLPVILALLGYSSQK